MQLPSWLPKSCLEGFQEVRKPGGLPGDAERCPPPSTPPTLVGLPSGLGFPVWSPPSAWRLLLVSSSELPAVASNTPWLNSGSFVKFLRLEGAAPRSQFSEWQCSIEGVWFIIKR